jgi:hypothetical protein
MIFYYIFPFPYAPRLIKEVMKTSYYAKVKNNINGVSIATSTPIWFKGREYKLLAPPWKIVKNYKQGKIDEQEYTKLYYHYVLDRLDPKQVLKELGIKIEEL